MLTSIDRALLAPAPRLAERLAFGVLVLATAALAWVKLRHFYAGYAYADMALFSNALHNTDFRHTLMRVEEFAIARNFSSLLQDHFQPTTLLLWPLVRLFGGGALIVAGIAAYLTPALLALRYLVRTAAPGWAVLLVPSLWAANELVFRQMVDGVYGFHNDLQFPFYGAIALYLTLTERWRAAALAWVLFLGVKETAPLYAGSYAFLMILWAMRDASRSRALYFGGLWLLSCLWLALALKGVPLLFGGEQIYATRGAELLADPARMVLRRDHILDGLQLYLYWWPALLRPTYVIATLPDFLALLIYGVSPVLYYGLVLQTFLLFGTVRAVPRVAAWAGRDATAQRLVLAGVGIVLLVEALHLGGNLRHAMLRTHPRLYAASDAAIREALGKVERACRVAISPVGQRYIERYPYVVGLHYVAMAKYARFVVELEPSDAGRRLAGSRRVVEMYGDLAAFRDKLETIHSGPGVKVHLNREGLCPGRT